MAASDNLSGVQFRDTQDSNSHVLSLHQNGAEKAYVRYETEPDQVNVEWLQSHEENKGHATRVMDELYRRFPEHHIDWGELVHPASEHLNEKFDAKYGRTSGSEPWENL